MYSIAHTQTIESIHIQFRMNVRKGSLIDESDLFQTTFEADEN